MLTPSVKGATAQRLRFLWARHLQWTAERLERKAVRVFKRAEECRALADRHFERLVNDV